jgi:hypothetical protein
MDMKIDGQHHSTGTGRTQRGEVPSDTGRTGAAGAPRISFATDRVETSPDLRLAAAATSAIFTMPDVRPEAVERGRKAMADGTVGSDANRLADAILTSLLGQ